MAPNFLVILASAFIPFVLAYAWYHPSLFGGDTWQSITGMTDEQNARPIKPIQLGLSILLNLLIAMALFSMVNHGANIISLVGGDPEVLKSGTAKAFFDEYGTNHTHFGHGLLHGMIGAVFVVFPILGYATIYERKPFKYFWVNALFWMISMGIMGGVICEWGWTLMV